MLNLKVRLLTLLKTGVALALPHLKRGGVQVFAKIREKLPGKLPRLRRSWHLPSREEIDLTLKHWSEEAKLLLQPGELKHRWQNLRTWAIEHDTVPDGVVAQRREKHQQIVERHEAREANRHQEEEARVKKDEEVQDVHNLYFQ
jgi:hypothetical protein